MLRKTHKVLFWVLVTLLPLNLAKHFFFDWVFVSGILVDYLIPTVYLTDLLILAILVLWDLDLLLNKERAKFRASPVPVFVLILAYAVLLSFSAKSPTSIFKLLKIFEMILLFLYTTLNFSVKEDFEKLANALSVSVFFQSALSFAQWIKGGSVFNNFLFFGEQPYSFRTPGISYESYFGVAKIPPYGTFPHPNVLGGFLAVSLTILAYFLITKKTSAFKILSFLYGVIVLLLTGSFTSYLAFISGLAFLILYKIFGKNISKIFFLTLVAVNILMVQFYSFERFDSLPSIYRRKDLIEISIKMINESPISGVGLNMYPAKMSDFGRVRGVINFVQPVHNIYLLAASEVGIFALAVFIFLIYRILKTSGDSEEGLIFIISLWELLLIGTFDHYPMTIQQGLLLFWLTLGMVLSTITVHAKTRSQP